MIDECEFAPQKPMVLDRLIIELQISAGMTKEQQRAILYDLDDSDVFLPTLTRNIAQALRKAKLTQIDFVLKN